MKAHSKDKYELYHFKDKNAFTVLQFVETEEDGSGGYNIVKDGVTNEEVLRSLLHRLKAQNELSPNAETEEAIKHLVGAGKALSAYYKRNDVPPAEEHGVTT